MSPDNASLNVTPPMEAPSTVIIFVQVMLLWLYRDLIPAMRERYGTRFIVFAPGHMVERLRTEICGPEDKVFEILLPELAGDHEPEDFEAALAEAVENERRYDIAYIRDLAQQIRGLGSNYFTHAPEGPHALTPTITWARAVNRFNAGFAYFRELIDQENVDLVIGRIDVGYANLTCLSIAEACGIPATFPYPIRHKAYVNWTGGAYGDGAHIEQVYRTIDKATLPEDYHVDMPSGSDLLWKRATSEYSFMRSVRKVLVETWNHAHFLVEDLKRGRRPGTGRLRYRASLRHIVNMWRAASWIDRHSETDFEKLTARPFLLFLLPQEPEFSVQSMCREFPHTLTIIQQLAMSLPANTRLVIKEHAILKGRRVSFYKDILRMPNVALAHRLIPGLRLVEKADGVATISGTSALEATRLGKPVVLFGKHVEYKFLENMVRVDKFDDLPRRLRDVLRPRTDAESKEIRSIGAAYREASVRLSFPAADTPLFLGKRERLEPEELDRAIETLLGNYAFQKANNKVVAQA